MELLTQFHEQQQLKSRKSLLVRITDEVDQINVDNSKAAGLTGEETKRLFKAKCQDLQIPEVISMYAKFHNNMISTCRKREFIISGAQVGPETARVVARIMRENTSFNRINLSSNIIGDEGITVLADALRQDNTVEP